MLWKARWDNLWFFAAVEYCHMGDISIGKQTSDFATWAICSIAELPFLIPDLSPYALMSAEDTVDLSYHMKYKNEVDWQMSNSCYKLLNELLEKNLARVGEEGKTLQLKSLWQWYLQVHQSSVPVRGWVFTCQLWAI